MLPPESLIDLISEKLGIGKSLIGALTIESVQQWDYKKEANWHFLIKKGGKS